MSQLPSTVYGLIEELEDQYPPKCYDPTSETIEEHLRYAGRVALISHLRERHKASERSSSKLPKVL